ncbi:MAG: transcription termination factor NusA, partial [bacterium]
PPNLGRVAAQTARQVIQQRIRDAERQAQLNYYQKEVGEIVSGVVQAVNTQGLTIGLELRAEGSMQRKDMIPGERFHVHDRTRALVAEVKDSNRGPQIILSRTHRDFLRRLLETEVPEIYHGVVEIRSIAREPGERAKVAVSATQQGIDPVGACVGVRGVRIQAIVRELHDEKIDVIEWNNDAAVFIQKAISPARVVGVYLTDRTAANKTATVVVPEDQLSLAIGRDGQNARLAAKLTGWRIDIKSLSEAAADAWGRLRDDESLAKIAEAEKDFLPVLDTMLAKKAEGRPLTPEEYDQMARFVDRVESRRIAIQTPVEPVVSPFEVELRSKFPERIFTQKILDSGLSEHVNNLLQEAGYLTVGDLASQVRLDPDRIYRINGIGPKALSEINTLIDNLEAEMAPVVEPESVAAVEAAVESQPEPALELVSEIMEATAEEAAPAEVTAPAEEEVEEITSLDEIFTLKPEMLEVTSVSDEEEDTSSSGQKTEGGKKKKKKFREVEYDPDRDITYVRRKHKNEEGGSWDW